MKTKSILHLPALILALALAYAPRSQAIIYTWNTYSTTAFDVVITGTGPWSGTTASPNGLWHVNACASMASDSPSPGLCEISDGGVRTTYFGTISRIPQPYMTLQGYSDIFPEMAGIHDSDSFQNDFGVPLWTGSAPITITSMPNIHDASTWTWTEEISGQVIAVPEPATLSLSLLGFGFLARRKFARRTQGKS